MDEGRRGDDDELTVRVKLRRSGGIAGLTLPPGGPLELDSRELPDTEALELDTLVRGSSAARGSAKQTGRTPGADRFVYDVSMDDGGQSARARMSADELSPELRRALDRLLLRHLETSR